MIIKAIVLGILQGLTEFLPISSSGHLVLAQRLLGFDYPGVTFEVAVHMGTLLAIVVAYASDLVDLLKGIVGGRPKSMAPREARRLVVLLITGSIPAGVAGLALKGTFEGLFQSVLAVGIALVFTGFILSVAGSSVHGRRKAEDLGIRGSILVGLAQALAITPGISRSGTTVSASLGLGLKPREAARFSFLLSLPAVGGAALLDLSGAAWSGTPFTPLLAGGLAAFVSGLLAIRTLLEMLGKGRFGCFRYYCYALGGLAIAWHILGV